MTKRIPTPDFLRGLAVVLMIQIHITELFASPEVFHSLAGKISLFLGGVPAAPLFMTVMGYFVIWRAKKAGVLVKRGIRLFIYGIFLNIGLNFHLLVKIADGSFSYDPLKYIFGVDILPLAGLSLIALALFIKIKAHHPLVYILTAALITFITPMLSGITQIEGISEYVLAFLWGDVKWSYFPLFPWLAYPLAGASFYYLERTDFFKTYFYYFIALATLLTAVFMFKGFTVSTTLQEYYHHGGVFFLWAIGFISLLVFALSRLRKAIAETFADQYLQFLGRHVTATYVFQWLIIGNIATAIYRTQSMAASLAWFVGILLVTSLLVWLYSFYRKRQSAKLKYRI
ncbi:MAG: heparan-alpha-glucosaminide N-acetyltransferase domain-containing protein [Bacteroidales bacterium]|nr:heparan-alpha-glucosaminide N-acetyltransferase domain-containing protein [Bacteroidales bacterium]